MSARRVIAHVTMSLDGCTGGPDGVEHDQWLYEHAGRQATAMAFESVWRHCDTAIVGRTNYVGFASVWPGIETDPATDPDTRNLAHWLNTVEKVVFSRTLTEPTWANSRIATDVGAAVRELHASPVWYVLIAYTLLCLGLALLFTPLFTSGPGSLKPHLYSHGSAVIGTLMQVAGATGTAFVRRAHGEPSRLTRGERSRRAGGAGRRHASRLHVRWIPVPGSDRRGLLRATPGGAIHGARPVPLTG